MHQRVHDLQAAFYAAGAEVASVEQAIEHAKETGEQQRAEGVHLYPGAEGLIIIGV